MNTTTSDSPLGLGADLGGIARLKHDFAFWQRLLRLGGFDPGPIDGKDGPRSRKAETLWLEEAMAGKRECGCFDARSEKNLATLLPAAQRAARRWLSDAANIASAQNMRVLVICGTRSYAEQDALWRQRPRVTRAKGGQSWHNFGLAWDFGIFRENAYCPEHPLYDELGALCKHIEGTEWGGAWPSFPDKPHVQLNCFSSIREARRAFER